MVQGDDAAAAPEWISAAADAEARIPSYYRLQGALCYLSFGKEVEGKHEMNQVAGTAFSPEGESVEAAMKQMAGLMIKCLEEKGKSLDRQKVREIVDKEAPADRGELLFMAGKFHWVMGNKEEAREYLKEVRPYFYTQRWTTTFAEQLLRQDGAP
jgi:hypothetical protein